MFPEDAACVAGHFPGNPVVPAAAILAELIPWVEAQLDRKVSGVTSARFRRPLIPGTSRLKRWMAAPSPLSAAIRAGLP